MFVANLVPIHPQTAQLVAVTPSEPSQETHVHAIAGTSTPVALYVQPVASSPVVLLAPQQQTAPLVTPAST